MQGQRDNPRLEENKTSNKTARYIMELLFVDLVAFFTISFNIYLSNIVRSLIHLA